MRDDVADEVPLWLRPPFVVGAWTVAGLWYVGNELVRLTSDVRIEGAEKLRGLDRYILCGWHNTIGPFLVAFPRLEGHVWLNHPAWFMKPVHLLVGWMGVELALGSSGERGRAAAKAVSDALRRGARTVIWPDGPAGPPFVAKSGVLHIAYESGAPIVPYRIATRGDLRITRSWDQKRFPLPFGAVHVMIGDPIEPPRVQSKEAYEKVREALSAALGDGGLSAEPKPTSSCR
jgi:lysophospholipid acyltransferase (LPLAT)-like uncharacterized protein